MNKRKFSQIERSILGKQVNYICPLEQVPFESKKNNGNVTYVFECAHIYPENPSAKEIELLKNEERLSDDSNDLNNIIALSPTAHRKYDSNKTIDEYRILCAIKKQAILQENIDSFLNYPIEQELFVAAEKLYDMDLNDNSFELSYKSLKISSKISAKSDVLLLKKIEGYVSRYFLYLQSVFKNHEKLKQKFNVISAQIKLFYEKTKFETVDKSLIFNSISNWFKIKNITNNTEAMEILTSYFVQNCEIFEEDK